MSIRITANERVGRTPSTPSLIEFHPRHLPAVIELLEQAQARINDEPLEDES